MFDFISCSDGVPNGYPTMLQKILLFLSLCFNPGIVVSVDKRM